MLVGLMAAAAPVSAKNLAFTPETLPSTTNNVLATVQIYDIAVAADGQTMYAATNTSSIYKSTNAGATWSTVATTNGNTTAINPVFVAVAADDANLFVIANATGDVYVSTNGGTTFGDLGDTIGGTVNDLALSTEYAGGNYVAVADNTGDVWIQKLGIGGTWTQIDTRNGFNIAVNGTAVAATNALAVEFSPNFASDQVLLAVTDDGTNTKLQMYSVNQNLWNKSAGFDNFAVTLSDSAGAALTGATSASLALSPTYLGGDEVERVVFIGVNGGAANDNGIYRVEDYTPKSLKSAADIWSVAFDGSVLVGSTTAGRVWRSNDPLASTPTFFVSAETKSPSAVAGSNPVLVYAGTNVVAGSRGANSAFSRSIDSGLSFNDISLINTAITNINDGAVAADGSVKYVLADNGTYLSLWRYASGSWSRVFSIADTAYIMGIDGANPDVVYLAKPAAKTLYFSNNGGTTRWYSRASRFDIQDIAVESEDVAYVAVDGDSSVSKTVNSGFTWGNAESTSLMSGAIHSITSVAEDQVMVGGTTGFVSYSTDGGDSWTRIEQNIKTAAPGGNVVLAASSLEAGGFIYAAAQTGGGPYIGVTRWRIGQPNVPWFDLLAPATAGFGSYGIALNNGVLYVNQTDGTSSQVIRTLMPEVGVASANYWSSYTDTGTSNLPTNNPSNLIVTNGAFMGVQGNTIYIIDTTGAAGNDFFKSCIDTLALTGPTQSGPPDGSDVKLNPISGGISNVALTWARISEATAYDYQVAYDDAFVSVLPQYDFGTVTSTQATVAGVVSGANLNLGTTYYWRVRASTPVTSPWSEAQSFTVESGGSVSPGIGSPANGATVTDTSPAFSWNPVAGATRYEFQLSADTSFAAPLASSQHAATAAQPDVTLEAGQTYFWRVRSIEPAVGEWSTIANFTVAVAAPPGGTPTITIPPITIPPITVPTPTVTVQPAPDGGGEAIPTGLLWTVIIIGAVLVIALIVLIVRTRRVS